MIVSRSSHERRIDWNERWKEREVAIQASTRSTEKEPEAREANAISHRDSGDALWRSRNSDMSGTVAPPVAR
jgi:hypothetical protein